MAPRVVDWPSASSIRSPRHRLALRVVDWPSTSSIGSPRRRLGHHVVDWVATSLIGSPRRPWPTGSSIRMRYGRFACWAVDLPTVLSFDPGYCRSALRRRSSSRGREGRGQWLQGKRKGQRTGHDKKSWLVFETHRLGLPFHGSPLCSSFPFAFSSIKCDCDGPTSLRKGEGHRVDFSSAIGSEPGR